MTPEKAAYMKAYRARNLDRIRRSNREYYWMHREKLLIYQKAYRDKIRANMTEDDLERRREYQRVMSKVYRDGKKQKEQSTR